MAKLMPLIVTKCFNAVKQYINPNNDREIGLNFFVGVRGYKLKVNFFQVIRQVMPRPTCG